MNSIKIEFAGKERGFTFGLYVLGELLEYYDTDIVGFGEKMQKNPFKVIPVVLYQGHAFDLKINKQPVDVTLEDVALWADEGYGDGRVDRIIGVLMDSMRKNVPGLAEAMDDKDGKKK